MKLRPQQTVHRGWSRDKIGLKRILIQIVVGSLPGLVWTASLSLSESMVSGGLQIH